MEEGRHVCVGLDSELGKIPSAVGGASTDPSRMQVFNARIISATCDLAAAYKLNFAFYLAQGPQGLEVLRQSIQTIHEHAPHAIVILDAKFGDIGNSNRGYVSFVFDWCGADAVTVAPYMGEESLMPFLDHRNKGIFVLCRTSNPGAGEFQDLKLDYRFGQHAYADLSLYQEVALNVESNWNCAGNCALVVGATAPNELAGVRELVPDIPLLLPGVGKQGGDLKASVMAAQHNFLINSSRGIIFASTDTDFATRAREETKKLHHQIVACLAAGGVR
jgi:orotidine-5'-phosphate decarboxylase